MRTYRYACTQCTSISLYRFRSCQTCGGKNIVLASTAQIANRSASSTSNCTSSLQSNVTVATVLTFVVLSAYVFRYGLPPILSDGPARTTAMACAAVEAGRLVSFHVRALLSFIPHDK